MCKGDRCERQQTKQVACTTRRGVTCTTNALLVLVTNVTTVNFCVYLNLKRDINLSVAIQLLNFLLLFFNYVGTFGCRDNPLYGKNLLKITSYTVYSIVDYHPQHCLYCIFSSSNHFIGSTQGELAYDNVINFPKSTLGTVGWDY